MLDAAEESGALRPGGTIIEPTSGNTGIGLAWIAAARGYRTLIVMPDSMSPERRALIQAYGAELVLTDGALGMKGAIARAQELARSRSPGSLLPGQFSNPANPAVHRADDRPRDLGGYRRHVDIFVAGVGTGGTRHGRGRVSEVAESRPCAWWRWSRPVQRGAGRAARPGPHRFAGRRRGLRAGDAQHLRLRRGLPRGRMRNAFAAPAGRWCGWTGPARRASRPARRLHAAAVLARRAENAGKTDRGACCRIRASGTCRARDASGNARTAGVTSGGEGQRGYSFGASTGVTMGLPFWSTRTVRPQPTARLGITTR